MRPLARWNPARDVWEVPDTDNLLCAHWAVFSETFPTSGMTVAGTAYEQPTSEPRTDGSASSSLPPTPTSQAAKHSADDRGPGTLDDHNLWSVAARLLPTPQTSDTNGPGEHGTGGPDLRTAVSCLPLARPTAPREDQASEVRRAT